MKSSEACDIAEKYHREKAPTKSEIDALFADALALIKKAASAGFFEMDVKIINQGSIHPETRKSLQELGYVFKKDEFAFRETISWFK